jgi:hypothetical protein
LVEDNEDNTTVEETSKDDSIERFRAAQEQFVASRTTRFELLDDALVMLLRIVSKPVWTRILVSNGVDAMAMKAEDIKMAGLNKNRGLEILIQEQMEQNRVKIIDALVDRAGVDVPDWFSASMLDEDVADQFLEDYAIELVRVGKEDGREDALIEKFRKNGILADDGALEQGASGEDTEPVDETIPDTI